MYFPWVLMGFNILMGGYPLLELVGVLAGHVYYFLMYVYPETNGRRLIECPDILYVGLLALCGVSVICARRGLGTRCRHMCPLPLIDLSAESHCKGMARIL